MIPEIDRIVKFFLHIFHLQSGGAGEMEMPGAYELVSADSDPLRIYELRIPLASSFKTRRMSIRRIGESVESKSTCYVVTYDDLLVIKIPPFPLADFNKYLENIHFELEIGKRLSPWVHCLTPTLSCILKKIPEIAGKISKEASDTESAYVELLTKEPRYQGNLKIGDRFAYFMSLSKHPFFNQVIEKIHGTPQWVYEEIYKHSRIFMNLDAFESIYGELHMELYDRIHAMIKAFRLKVDAMLTLYGDYPAIPDFLKEEWIFAALARQPVHLKMEDLPPEFLEDVHNLIQSFIDENKTTVADYQKTVSTYVRKKNFEKNRRRMEALVINILELIYRLKGSCIAIRDLKPDNILIMSDLSDVYAHLSDPEKYKLGLIDVETAVDFSQKDPNRIQQPMLAGTSVYMTPAHIFKNETLTELFGKNIGRVFYMQDWFAAIAMMFDVVTGQWLFRKTAKLIPEIARERKKSQQNRQSLPDIYKNASLIFWKTAEAELSAGIQKHIDLFQWIHLTLPEHIIEMFCDEIETEKQIWQSMIQEFAVKLFPKKAPSLMKASYEDIRTQRIKAEQTLCRSEANQRLIAKLKQIEKLKYRFEHAKESPHMIRQTMICGDLMKWMLQRVRHALNPF